MVFQAAVLGAVQGLSEFLPISSSAHLNLVRWLFGWENFLLSPDQANSIAATSGISSETVYAHLDKAFDLSLHMGTAVAVVVYFRKDLVEIFSSLFTSEKSRAPQRRIAIGILIGSIPAALAGKFFEEKFDELFRSHLWTIAVALILFGLFLGWADRIGKKKRHIESLSLGDAIGIGCAQVLALAPGVSRSGITMTTGLALGLTREAAARFSFLLMTPIVIGAAVYKLKDLKALPPGALHAIMPGLVVGTVTSAFVGAACIAFLLKFLKTNSTMPFVIYRVIVGAAVLIILATGMRSG